MNTQRLHLRCDAGAAISHLQRWVGTPHPAFDTTADANGWTTVDLGGYDLGSQESNEWLRLGQQVDLLFESFSTSLCAGEVLLVAGGILRRHVVKDDDNADLQVDSGRLRCEAAGPFADWSDIWTLVEEAHWRGEVD